MVMRRNIEEMAARLPADIKRGQLAEMMSRMPDDRQGVEVEYNGRTYVTFIRRLTPTECDRLQGVTIHRGGAEVQLPHRLLLPRRRGLRPAPFRAGDERENQSQRMRGGGFVRFPFFHLKKGLSASIAAFSSFVKRK